MTVRTQYNELADSYELVADIDDVPIVFAERPGAGVRDRIEAVKASEAAAKEAAKAEKATRSSAAS